VSRDPLRSASRLRVLSDPDLRSQHARRHPVVGVLLDQRRRQSGARLHRPADTTLTILTTLTTLIDDHTDCTDTPHDAY